MPAATALLREKLSDHRGRGAFFVAAREDFLHTEFLTALFGEGNKKGNRLMSTTRFERLYPSYDWRGVQFEIRKAVRKSQPTYDPEFGSRYIRMLATAGIRTTIQGNGWDVRFHDVILVPGQQTDLLSFLMYIKNVDQHLDPVDQQIPRFRAKEQGMTLLLNPLSIGHESLQIFIGTEGTEKESEMRILYTVIIKAASPVSFREITKCIDPEKEAQEITGMVS